MITIRPETPADVEAIAVVNLAAFEQPGEAELVATLRDKGALAISLLAELNGEVIGHIAFSPMVLDKQSEEGRVLGLGPMAVLPVFQNQGVGLQLLEAGLLACRQSGIEIVIVLGHPEYYPKVGFEPASRFGILCQYDVSDEVFMAIELVPDTMKSYSGVANYHPAFDTVS